MATPDQDGLTAALQPATLDASVWIRYLRASGSEDLKQKVRDALRRNRVVACWPAILEVLVGCRDEKDFTVAESAFALLPTMPITDQTWRAASNLGYILRRRGYSIGLPDLLIAQIARENNLVLWHADAHFEQIAEVIPLATRNFLPDRR